MQQVNLIPNPQIAIIFKGWADDWAKESDPSQKDTATKFHTVYRIAAELFLKGGAVELSLLNNLFEDCKQKLEHAHAMIKKIELALADDPQKAEAIIKKINTTAQDAAHVVRYLGEILKPSAK
ncbi:hypothetical protein ABT56_12725 [Photobacterium aquae]|uniref:Uncharacterized protein n=1 Tax=Photobacterium aquae TaxID=1195763 RepID=A0A0J1JSJ4_9GAMM|nr:hypothetical protein [Photobacterium aquae]KLV05232.1 hypothetical protein ABT56_12725 [Photobacterium aquae]